MLIQWDETITTIKTQVIDEDEQTVEVTTTVPLQKWLRSMTDEEAYSHGYMRVEYLPTPDYDRLTHKYITGTLSDGSEIDGKWVVGGTLVETTADEKQAIKAAKKAEVKQWRTLAMQTGRCDSTFGYDIDARRYGEYDDLQNIEGAIELGSTVVMDADGNTHPVTAEQLAVIRTQILLYGQRVIYRKWELDTAIDAATTQDELEAIVW